MEMNHRIKDWGTDKKRDAITQEEVRGKWIEKEEQGREGLHLVVSDSSSWKAEIKCRT